ncbi:MAG TPA: DHA2 family efflux MFS transporter permease subunit [Acidimicrobiia bacterium]|nr:DHA2 family efflux MFS transporter permease subunit [Acidimicrobiia bacterium]
MTQPSHPQSPPPGVDYTRRWWVLVAVGMGIFLGTIDGSIVNVALPTLVDEFNTSFSVVQWVVLGYLLTLATLVLGIGRVGDMVGKKPIYAAGFVVFTIGSMLAGLAPTVGWLIGFRVFQAVGAAMVFALGFAIVTEAFPPQERGRALGIMGSVVSIGIVVGPSLGGFLIDAISWRWIFYVNLPVGIVGTITALRFIPRVPPPGQQRFDYLGAFTFLLALAPLLLGLTLGQERGFGDRPVIALLVVSAVGLAAFLGIERRVPQPMLDLTLFRNRLLSVNLFTGWISFIGIAGLLILLPFYLENVLGYEPRQVGLLLAAAPVALGVAAPLSGSLSDRIGPRPVTVAGLAVLTVGYFLARYLDTDTTILVYMLILIPIGAGMGIFQSPNNSAVMGSVPPQRLGVTSGMLTITRITGQIFGISVLGTIWAARVNAAAGSSGDASDAPAAAQVAGLQDTALVVALLTAFALGVATWGLLLEQRERAAAHASRSPEDSAV